MGYGFECVCEKCGYSIDTMFGVGMLGYKVLEDETKKMRAGKYGEQGKRFFKEHPDGSVTVDYVVTKCMSCGELSNVHEFNLQIPEQEIEKTLGWTENVTIEKYEHKCKKCGGKTEIIENFEELAQKGKIECPRCGNKLTTAGYYCWD